MELFRISAKRKNETKPLFMLRVEETAEIALQKAREKFPEMDDFEVIVSDVDEIIRSNQELKDNNTKKAEGRFHKIMSLREKLHLYEIWLKKMTANNALSSYRVHFEGTHIYHDCLSRNPISAEKSALDFYPDLIVSVVSPLNLNEQIKEIKTSIKEIEKKMEINIRQISQRSFKIRQLMVFKRMIENNNSLFEDEDESLIIE